MNKVEIKHGKRNTTIVINGHKPEGILDYKIRKNSASSNTELILVLDVISLCEEFTE